MTKSLLALAALLLVVGCGQEHEIQSRETTLDFSALTNGTEVVEHAEPAPPLKLDPEVAAEVVKQASPIVQVYYEAAQALLKAIDLPEKTDEEKKKKQEELDKTGKAVAAEVLKLSKAIEPLAKLLKVPEGAKLHIDLEKTALSYAYVKDGKKLLTIDVTLGVVDGKVRTVVIKATAPKPE